MRTGPNQCLHVTAPCTFFPLPPGHVFDLLAQCPEQEQSLLSMLVNKLGDPDGKVASRTSLFLLKLGEGVGVGGDEGE